MPVISVIVPIYNTEPYLRKCIDSILNQFFKDFELILVDDGSKDNCPIICDEYAKIDKRIVVIHKENGGVASARNTGVSFAIQSNKKGYLSFIDPDDYVSKDYLSSLYDALIRNNTKISACLYTDKKDELQVKIIPRSCKLLSVEDYYCAGNLVANSCCFKLFDKALWKGITFPNCKLYEDNATIYKVLFRTKSIALISEPLYYYQSRDDSLTKNVMSDSHFSLIECCKERINFFKSLRNEKMFIYSIKLYLDSIMWLTNFSDSSANKVFKKKLLRIMTNEINEYKMLLGKDIYSYYLGCFNNSKKNLWYYFYYLKYNGFRHAVHRFLTFKL